MKSLAKHSVKAQLSSRYAQGRILLNTKMRSIYFLEAVNKTLCYSNQLSNSCAYYFGFGLYFAFFTGNICFCILCHNYPRCTELYI